MKKKNNNNNNNNKFKNNTMLFDLWTTSSVTYLWSCMWTDSSVCFFFFQNADVKQKLSGSEREKEVNEYFMQCTYCLDQIWKFP